MTSGSFLLDQSGSSKVNDDGRVVSEYTEVYMFYTDAGARPTFATITAAMSLSPGSPYFADTDATLRDVAIGSYQTKPTKLKYRVTAHWSTDAPLPASTDTDPTTRRTIWGIRPTIQQRFIIRDRANELIVQTAGQPFDGGIPVDVRLGTVTATRNITGAGYDKDVVLANSGKLNSAIFLGGAIGTVQVDIETDEAYEGSYHFWKEKYTFTYDPLGHQPKPASVGFFQRSGIGLVRITERDIGGNNSNPVLEPEPLTTAGIVAPLAGRPGNCAFVSVDYFDTMDFSTFGL